MRSSRLSLLPALILVAAGGTPATAQVERGAPAAFALELPEWNPDPEDLPPELRPLGIVRPTVPGAVASDIAGWESRLRQLEERAVSAGARREQDQAIDEAIGLAEQIVAARESHQGNGGDVVRWRSPSGAPAEWHELADARRTLAFYSRLRAFSDEERAALRQLQETTEQLVASQRTGDYERALLIVRDRRATRERLFGSSDLRTLSSMNNEGFLLRALGRHEEAQEVFLEALGACRAALGDEHPQTLGMLNNLGHVAMTRGEIRRGAELFAEALAGASRVMGLQNLSTLRMINNLADARQALGDDSTTAALFRFALDGLSQLVGDDSQEVLIAANNLAGVEERRGRLRASRDVREQVARGCRVAFGPDHPFTLTAVVNLGRLDIKLGRFDEAEAGLREATRAFESRLGSLHPSSLNAMHSLGTLMHAQGRHADAEWYLRTALEGRRESLPPQHLDTLGSASVLSLVLIQLDSLDEAAALQQQAFEGYASTLGVTHPLTLTCENNLGFLRLRQQRSDEAIEHFEHVIAASGGETRGERVMHAFNNVGTAWMSQGDAGRAAEAFREALRLADTSTADREPFLIRVCFHLALAEEALLRPDVALDLYARALRSAEGVRPRVIGGAAERAAVAESIGATRIARSMSLLCARTGESRTALTTIERGRGRAALDLLSTRAIDSLGSSTSLPPSAAMDQAVRAERAALAALREAEARLVAAERSEQ